MLFQRIKNYLRLVSSRLTLKTFSRFNLVSNKVVNYNSQKLLFPRIFSKYRDKNSISKEKTWNFDFDQIRTSYIHVLQLKPYKQNIDINTVSLSNSIDLEKKRLRDFAQV